MGITATWVDDTQTTVLVRFEGSWTWNDLRTALEQSENMMKSVPHVVDMINDLSQSSGVPSGALTEARGMMKSVDPKKGLVIVVRAGTLAQSLYSMFQNLYGRRVGYPDAYFLDTLDDALTFIQQQRNARA